MFLQRILGRKKDLSRVLLRDQVYKAKHLANIVQDVIALANLPVRGERHIVFNASRDMNGELIVRAAERGAIKNLQGLVDKAAQFIEPELSVKVIVGDIDGKLGAALEVKKCSNKPYMVRANAADNLLPCSCWVKEGDNVRQASRKDFDALYGVSEKATLAETASKPVRVGLNGNPSEDYLKVELPDTALPPSAMAAALLKKTIALRESTVKDTGLLRLMHAKENLPYDERGINTLVQGYNSVVSEHLAEDNYYHFETKAVQLNLSVLNQMGEPLSNASLVLTIPNIEQCRVADRLYLNSQDQLTPKESQIQGYPTVKYFNDTVRIKATMEEVKPDEVSAVFKTALRLSCQPVLRGKKIAMHYTLNADNLASPVSGRLRLGFI